MSHNCLTALPAGLGYLHRLTRLVASDNRLAALPDEIGSMTSEWRPGATRMSGTAVRRFGKGGGRRADAKGTDMCGFDADYGTWMGSETEITTR